MRTRNGIVIAGSLLLAGCSGTPSGTSSAGAGREPEVETYVVRAEAPRSATVHTSSSTLTVEHEADVLAQEEGMLTQVLADEGQRVKKSDVLARLDDSRIHKQMEQDRASLQSLEVKAREAGVLREAATVELKRQTELHDSGLGSMRDYDRARFSLEAYGHEVEAAKFDLERARARVGEDELRLSWMVLRAPFDGIVSRRYAREGEMMLGNAKVLRVTELRPLVVRFTAPESLRASVPANSPVFVRMSTPPFERVRARVVRTSYVVDAASGSLECTAQLAEPLPARLVPGMAVEVEVTGDTNESADGMIVPHSAVLREPGGQATVLVVKAGQVQRRGVKIGTETTQTIHVLSGLTPGETVVLHPSDDLVDGMKVRARL